MPQTTTLDNQIVFKRDYRSGANWTLVSQTEFDGLGRSQIVRVMDAPDRGFGETETHSKLARRLDATADADNFDTNGAGATVDAHRYVVDPLVERHQYPGLFTGGPARHGKDQGGKKILTQTLTRTFCAGHGFTVDEHGRFVYSTDPTSHGYATVEDALALHRATVKRSFSVRMAFRSDVPGFYRTELVWRDFTHESLPFLNGEDGKAAVVAAAKRQFDEDLGSVLGVSTQVDPETNTVVVTAAALLKQLQEPTSAEDLLAMPRLEGPCTRETLREFGWNDLADGEGYRFVHLFKWIDIKDTPAVRAFLDGGVFDKDVLPGLLPEAYVADAPYLVSGASGAENGRFAYGGGAWWRILKTAVQPDESDGSLVFTLACMKPRWFGKVDAEHRVEAVRENPQGIGEGMRSVFPSVPRDFAEEEAKRVGPVTTDEGKKFLVGAVQRQEGEGGREDISVQHARVFTWQGDDKPELTQKLDGVEGSAVTHTTTAKREEWDVTFDRLDGDAMAALIQAVTEQLVPDPERGKVTVKGVTQVGDGAYRLVLHAQGVKKVDIAAWLYTGTYFYEIWRALHFNFKLSECTEGGLDGHDIVTSDRSLNDDATLDERVDRKKASPPRHLVYKAKNRAHGRPVTHDWFRNEVELPDGLKDGSVAGHAAYNEFGYIDGETTDVDNDDGSGKTIVEDHFHKVESEQSTDETSREAEAEFKTGVITKVSETDNGDGTFTHSVTKDEAKECSHVHFKTKEGSLHNPRIVDHHVFVNAPEIPAVLENPPDGTARVSGSVKHNNYGLHDGSTAEWDAAEEEGWQETKRENRFKVEKSQTGSGEHAPEIQEFEPGKIASHTKVSFPDGEERITAGTDEAKAAEWSYEYTIRRDDRAGKVRVFVWKNQAEKPQIDEPAGDETLSLDEELNAYDLWDVKAVYSPNWKAKKKSGQDEADDSTQRADRYMIVHLGHARGNFSARVAPGSAARAPAYAPAKDGYWCVAKIGILFGKCSSADEAFDKAKEASRELGAVPKIEKIDDNPKTFMFTVEGPKTCGPIYNGPIPDFLNNNPTPATMERYFQG